MATKSAQPEPEKAEVIEEALDALDSTLDRVKVLYEQYFLGIQKQPPTYLHTDIERKLRDVAQLQIRNTALRYRFATLQQKFGSYNTYWRRTLRQIESGTYGRNLFKIGRQAVRTGADVPPEILAAMPKRMRDQVMRDREAALALARLREKPQEDELELLTLVEEDVDIDVEDLDLDAAVIEESSDVRRDALAGGTYKIDESDADFDLDAFFAKVANADGPDIELGPPNTGRRRSTGGLPIVGRAPTQQPRPPAESQRGGHPRPGSLSGAPIAGLAGDLGLPGGRARKPGRTGPGRRSTGQIPADRSGARSGPAAGARPGTLATPPSTVIAAGPPSAVIAADPSSAVIAAEASSADSEPVTEVSNPARRSDKPNPPKHAATQALPRFPRAPGAAQTSAAPSSPPAASSQAASSQVASSQAASSQAASSQAASSQAASSQVASSQATPPRATRAIPSIVQTPPLGTRTAAAPPPPPPQATRSIPVQGGNAPPQATRAAQSAPGAATPPGGARMPSVVGAATPPEGARMPSVASAATPPEGARSIPSVAAAAASSQGTRSIPSVPAAAAPSQGTRSIPSVPGAMAPSQATRSIPIAPGAAAAQAPTPVESMAGPFPRIPSIPLPVVPGGAKPSAIPARPASAKERGAVPRIIDPSSERSAPVDGRGTPAGSAAEGRRGSIDTDADEPTDVMSAAAPERPPSAPSPSAARAQAGASATAETARPPTLRAVEPGRPPPATGDRRPPRPGSPGEGAASGAAAPQRPAAPPRERPTPPSERREPDPPQAPPPGMSNADVNALYAKYVKAKEILGEEAGPGAYGKLLKTINAQAPKIMEQYNAKGVDFSVVVKDNQVIIRAKPKP